MTGPKSEPPIPTLITFRMGFPVWPFHWPLRTLMAKLCHALEYSVNLGHDVLAVDDDRCGPRRPQSDVQNCTLLRDIDFVATEHRIDSILKPAFLGQLNQEC